MKTSLSPIETTGIDLAPRLRRSAKPSELPAIFIDSYSTFWEERNSFGLIQIVHPGCQKTRTTSSMKPSFAATTNAVAKIVSSCDRLWADVAPDQWSRNRQSSISQIAIILTATVPSFKRRCNCFPSTTVDRSRSSPQDIDEIVYRFVIGRARVAASAKEES